MTDPAGWSSWCASFLLAGRAQARGYGGMLYERLAPIFDPPEPRKRTLQAQQDDTAVRTSRGLDPVHDGSGYAARTDGGPT